MSHILFQFKQCSVLVIRRARVGGRPGQTESVQYSRQSSNSFYNTDYIQGWETRYNYAVSSHSQVHSRKTKKFYSTLAFSLHIKKDHLKNLQKFRTLNRNVQQRKRSGPLMTRFLSCELCPLFYIYQKVDISENIISWDQLT